MNTEQGKHTIIDAVMGTGKSSWVIEQVKQNIHEKFVIVVPLLPEVERFEKALKEHRAVFAPMNIDPEDEDIDTKMKSFTKMLRAGEGVIITTHALFSLWDAECTDLIAQQGYVGILDETVDLVQESDISKDDYQMLLGSGYIREEPRNGQKNIKAIVHTAKTSEYSGKQKKFMKQALLNNLIKVDDSKYIQTIKPENIEAFSRCFVLTYMFLGSQMECWCRLYGLEVVHKTLERNEDTGELILVDHKGNYSGETFEDLITLIDEPGINAIGNQGRSRVFPFSNGWFEALSQEKWNKLINNLNNIARWRTGDFMVKIDGENASHPANFFMWSAKKKQQAKIEKGMRYKKVPDKSLIEFNADRDEDEKTTGECFVAHNQRATNNYAHKACLAYLTTPFPLVPIKNFFANCGLNFDDKTFMLSTLVQWVWRSRIRNGEKILLYVPSEPLRNLFKQWLSGTL